MKKMILKKNELALIATASKPTLIGAKVAIF